jgi:nucleoside-diphosphate-sugar epimerase
MRATIVGHKGFIGSHLYSFLSSQKWECYLPDRTVSWIIPGKNLGHIFYCAGTTSDYLDKITDTIDAHVVLLLKILKSGTFDSLTYLSSTRLYDNALQLEGNLEDISFALKSSEARNLFDLSKLLGESLCLQIGNPTVRVARISNVYSVGQESQGFIGELLNFVNQNYSSVMAIKGSPQDSRDYLDIEDLLPVLVKIAIKGQSRIYNIASGENTKNLEIASLIEEKCKKRINFFMTEILSPKPTVSIRNTSEEFNFKPRGFLSTFSEIIGA